MARHEQEHTQRRAPDGRAFFDSTKTRVGLEFARGERFPSPYSKIVPNTEAISRAAEWRAGGERVVMVDSVVDIPHYRHADYFRACANLGNRLIVRVEADELVKTRKDPRGPIVPFEARALHVAHYPYIDVVTDQVVHGLDFLEDFQPDVLVKSVTSGPLIIQQIDELSAHRERYPMDVVVMDQFANIVDPSTAYEEGTAYDADKYGSDKLSGSTIKQEITRRVLEDHRPTN